MIPFLYLWSFYDLNWMSSKRIFAKFPWSSLQNSHLGELNHSSLRNRIQNLRISDDPRRNGPGAQEMLAGEWPMLATSLVLLFRKHILRIQSDFPSELHQSNLFGYEVGGYGKRNWNGRWRPATTVLCGHGSHLPKKANCPLWARSPCTSPRSPCTSPLIRIQIDHGFEDHLDGLGRETHQPVDFKDQNGKQHWRYPKSVLWDPPHSLPHWELVLLVRTESKNSSHWFVTTCNMLDRFFLLFHVRHPAYPIFLP